MVTKPKSKAQASVNVHKLTWKSVLAFIITLVAGLLGGGIFMSITGDGEITVQPAVMELSEEQVPAVIETEDGGKETLDVPTVESIDGNQLQEEGDYGRGEYHDTSSPQAYRDATLGKCVINGNPFGAQCFALASDFWQNYAGRWLSSCGTGAAKGTLNCYEQNAGDEFKMIWDTHSLQAGDWVVFTNGLYGHIGMALGEYNNGYIALLGENQGGSKCEGGGSSTNIINISLKNFGGAFRPKDYIKEEPAPEPEPVEPASPDAPVAGETVKYVYVKGDTFGQVIKDLGLETEAGLWGEGGDVEFYTKQLIEQGMLDENGNVKLGQEFVLTMRAYI